MQELTRLFVPYFLLSLFELHVARRVGLTASSRLMVANKREDIEHLHRPAAPVSLERKVTGASCRGELWFVE